MLSVTLLVLIAGCTGSQDTDSTSTGDTDTDTDSDTDTDADADVTFDVVLPVSGATVMVDEVVVPCDASNVCTVNAEGDGTFSVTVTHPTLYFIPKTVVVTDGVPDASEISYTAGYCPSDANYDGTSWCDDWVMSTYETTVQGEYCDEQDRCYHTVTGHADLDGDGVEETMLDIYGGGVNGGTTWNASGLVMTSYTQGEMNGYGSMESDLSVITITYDRGGGDMFQKIFTRVSD